jgi:hypothetical protein
MSLACCFRAPEVCRGQNDERQDDNNVQEVVEDWTMVQGDPNKNRAQNGRQEHAKLI